MLHQVGYADPTGFFSAVRLVGYVVFFMLLNIYKTNPDLRGLPKLSSVAWGRFTEMAVRASTKAAKKQGRSSVAKSDDPTALRLQIITVCLAYAIVGPTLVIINNHILKSLSFLFEYIGEMGRDYVYAITPLLEDALIDRDLVHRQTACTTVKHMALGSIGLGCEDAMQHLMNLIWPNLFETSPHVINAVTPSSTRTLTPSLTLTLTLPLILTLPLTLTLTLTRCAAYDESGFCSTEPHDTPDTGDG